MPLITLIDDEEISNFLNRKMIESAALETDIEEFISSKEALNSILNRPQIELPNIILLDIRMPEINGFEFIERIIESNREDLNKIKIVVMTSSLYSKDKSKALSYPIVIDFINKPITIDNINSFREYL